MDIFVKCTAYIILLSIQCIAKVDWVLKKHSTTKYFHENDRDFMRGYDDRDRRGA